MDDLVVSLDPAHDPDAGHPVLPADADDATRAAPVWGVYAMSPGPEGPVYEPTGQDGLTAAQAMAVAGIEE